MKTNVEDISSVKKKLVIEIEAEQVNKKLSQTFKEVGKRAKIPGFRPGKIPRKILERYFGDQVMADVTRSLINETLPKAIEETNASPLTMPVIEKEALKGGQNFKYSALMEFRPEFELKDYMGLEAQKEICSVTEEDVNRRLEEIREAVGQLTPVVEDRGIREHDHVIIDYEGFEGTRAIEGTKVSNFSLKIGSNTLPPGFEKGLLGHKKGDETEIKVDFEKDDSPPSLAGKSVQFKVKVTDIQEKDLPELDDDFAKNLGGDFTVFDDFKKKLKADLIQRDESRIDRELKMRLIKKVSDSMDFELPESLLNSEIDNAIENLKRNLDRKGAGSSSADLRDEKLREGLRPASEKRVKEMLILAEIARRNDISVNEEELAEGFRKAAQSMGQEPEDLRQYYKANNLEDFFRQKLLEEKALNYLVKGAKVTEVEAGKIQN